MWTSDSILYEPIWKLCRLCANANKPLKLNPSTKASDDSVYFQDEEINMLTEVTHLQEILQQLCLGAGDPYALPASSEQVIRDLKGTDGHTWSFQVRLPLHVPPMVPFLGVAPLIVLTRLNTVTVTLRVKQLNELP